jgi:hypothetical protein
MSLTNSPFWFSSGATSAGGGGTVVYPTSINQSLRVDDSKSQRMYQNTVAGSAQKFTMSCWIKRTELSDAGTIFSSWNGASNFVNIYFSGDYLYVYICDNRSGFVDYNFNTQSAAGGGIIFRDVSAWYHIVVAVDTTQSYVYERYKIYINGVDTQARSGGSGNDLPLNYNMEINEASGQNFIFHNPDSSTYYGSFYVADMVYVDGTMYDANTFGEFINGIWVPKDISAQSISYGNNGFYLTFSDNSTASALGTDSSGNGNNFTTVNNFATSDQVPDSPTNNFATWNVLQPTGAAQGTMTLSEGNMKATGGSSIYRQVMGNMSVLGGKWYTEFYITDAGYPSWQVGWTKANRYEAFTGAGTESTDLANFGDFSTSNGFISTFGQASFGTQYAWSTLWSGGTAPTTGDVIGCAADFDNGKLWWSINGEWINIGAGAGDPANDSNPSATYTASDYEDDFKSPHYLNYNGSAVLNTGQDSTFAGNTTAGGNSDANGYGDFKYSVPSGFLAMCSANLPAPAIGPQLASGQQSDNYFETILYTGTGATQHIGSGGAQHPIDVTTVANSIRFNDDDSAYLSRTPASAGNRKTFTLSTWIKPNPAATNYPPIFNAGTSAPDTVIRLDNTGKLQVVLENGGGSDSQLTTNRTLKSSSTWYHILVAVDTTNATADDRIKIYIDGVEETSFASRTNPSLNLDTNINNTVVHKIGAQRYASYWDGYMAEMYFIDGTALDPTYFGQYGSNGYWIPKAVSGLTFGTNGFYLDFSDNSTATALGTDSSGNANNFSATNVATTDQMGDSPTQNFATFDPNRPSGTTLTLSEGNLKAERTSTSFAQAYSTFEMTSGKWYAEFLLDAGNSGVGVIAGRTIPSTNRYMGQDSYTYGYYVDGRKVNNATYTTYGDSYTTAADGSGDVIGVLIDADNGNISFSKNGTVQNSGIPAFSGIQGPFRFAIASESNCFHIANFGQDDTFSGFKTSGSAGAADGNGYGKFYDTPPTGYLALVNDNIPVEGITGPDFVWWKNRTDVASHMLGDSVRGAGKVLSSNNTDVELDSTSTYFSSFDYDGFTVGTANVTNGLNDKMVAWTWKAGGKANTFNIDGTGYASIAASPISDGTIPLTGLSTNTTSGFSILGYAGTGSNGTVAHGLSSAPEMFICRNRTNARDWLVYHKDIGYTKDIFLNLTNAERSNDVYQQQAPDNSLIYLETQDRINESGSNHIMWCFHSVDGYSRVGKYVGNNSTNGPFNYTGFRPAFVIIKRTDSTAGWVLYDDKRDTYNQMQYVLWPNLNNAEYTSNLLHVDFLSNGFKVRNATYGETNASGGSYIYIAFAEQPFKYANAR